MQKKYPSDVNREQFKKILPILESARKKTKPRKVDLYDVFCGILYLLKTGCQWRMLPKEYPKWRTVHEYFLIWSEKKNPETESILEEVLKKICWRGSTKTGLAAGKFKTSFCIVDAQSVKNTDTARVKGYDGGKKVSGIKRHIAVDTQGLLHAAIVTAANVGDREGAIKAFEYNVENLSNVEKVLADGGYTGEDFAIKVKEILGAEVEIAKRNELHKFVVLPKRWVVERSFAWLEKCRRLWKNCERLINSSLNMIYLAFIALLMRRF